MATIFSINLIVGTCTYASITPLCGVNDKPCVAAPKSLASLYDKLQVLCSLGLIRPRSVHQQTKLVRRHSPGLPADSLTRCYVLIPIRLSPRLSIGRRYFHHQYEDTHVMITKAMAAIGRHTGSS